MDNIGKGVGNKPQILFEGESKNEGILHIGLEGKTLNFKVHHVSEQDLLKLEDGDWEEIAERLVSIFDRTAARDNAISNLAFSSLTLSQHGMSYDHIKSFKHLEQDKADYAEIAKIIRGDKRASEPSFTPQQPDRAYTRDRETEALKEENQALREQLKQNSDATNKTIEDLQKKMTTMENELEDLKDPEEPLQPKKEKQLVDREEQLTYREKELANREKEYSEKYKALLQQEKELEAAKESHQLDLVDFSKNLNQHTQTVEEFEKEKAQTVEKFEKEKAEFEKNKENSRAEIEAERGRLKTLAASLATKPKEQDSQIKKLQDEKKGLEAKLAIETKAKEKAEDENRKLEQLEDQLQDQIIKINKQVVQLTEKNKAILDQYKRELDELEKSSRNVPKDKSHEEEIKRLQEQVGELTETQTLMENKLKLLTGDNAKIHLKNKENEKEINDLTEELQKVREKNNQLEESNKKNLRKEKTLSEKNDSLTAENSDLKNLILQAQEEKLKGKSLPLESSQITPESQTDEVLPSQEDMITLIKLVEEQTESLAQKDKAMDFFLDLLLVDKIEIVTLRDEVGKMSPLLKMDGLSSSSALSKGMLKMAEILEQIEDLKKQTKEKLKQSTSADYDKITAGYFDTTKELYIKLKKQTEENIEEDTKL